MTAPAARWPRPTPGATSPPSPMTAPAGSPPLPTRPPTPTRPPPATSPLDANGRRTTFAYDTMNRLSEKVPDPFFSSPTVRFTYTATGQRQSMLDATGTTTYTYDPQRDWLTTKAGPQGTLSYAYEP